MSPRISEHLSEQLDYYLYTDMDRWISRQIYSKLRDTIGEGLLQQLDRQLTSHLWEKEPK